MSAVYIPEIAQHEEIRDTGNSDALHLRLRLPHPIPYQGSKRVLAPQILAVLQGKRFRTFYEPFAGSAAITIAAAQAKIAHEYVISDSLQPLMQIWEQMLHKPYELTKAYEKLWGGQLESNEEYYFQIRERFNQSRDAASLLYLLARCVKNAPRFNQQGAFNQSHDRRRLGMHPDKMRLEILGASALLRGKARTHCADFAEVIAEATPEDIVYMDPPYEGTTSGANKRYHQGLSRERLIATLADLNNRGVPFLLSYDGQCGNRTYGSALPASLHLTRRDLHAGRSSQATLHGRSEMTVESLYISHDLAMDC